MKNWDEDIKDKRLKELIKKWGLNIIEKKKKEMRGGKSMKKVERRKKWRKRILIMSMENLKEKKRWKSRKRIENEVIGIMKEKIKKIEIKIGNDEIMIKLGSEIEKKMIKKIFLRKKKRMKLKKKERIKMKEGKEKKKKKKGRWKRKDGGRSNKVKNMVDELIELRKMMLLRIDELSKGVGKMINEKIEIIKKKIIERIIKNERRRKVKSLE